MSPARLQRRTAERLKSAGIESAEAEAGLLIEAASGLSRAELLLQTGPLTGEAMALLEAMVLRRLLREPLQYVVGTAWFYGLELKVDPRALIPRFETEVLVELALKRLDGIREPFVIDVATGSGAIALAVAQERPDARVMATDISAAALELADENAIRTGLKVDLVQADLLSGLRSQAARADVIISNPPYLPEGDRLKVSPEVRRDPGLALYAGDDGLDVFRRLLHQARGLLKPGAWLLVELDPRNVNAAAALAVGFSEVRIEKDMTGRERFLLLSRS